MDNYIIWSFAIYSDRFKLEKNIKTNLNYKSAIFIGLISNIIFSAWR